MKNLATLLLLFMSLTIFNSELSAQKINKHNNNHINHQHTVDYMSDQDFDVLFNRVKNKNFKSDQLELIEVGSLDSRFSCRQCQEIISIFTFDDDKLSALRMMSKRIVDIRNAPMLISCFTFESSKREAKKLLSFER